MLEGIKRIEESAFITDIVKNDYRTAAVFKKHDIDFCCGGKFPLEIICANKDIDIKEVIRELEDKFGFENLYNLKGGILGYIDDIDPTLTRY